MRQELRSTALLVIPVLIPTVFGSSSAVAQSVRGTLVDAATDSTIEGGVVTLFDAAGERVTRTLVGDDGAFLIIAPAPGRYTLEGAALGYERTRTDPFPVDVGETVERTLRLRARPFGLEGLSVEVRPRCRPRPDATADGQRLWEAARTALAAVSATEEAGAVAFRASRYDRDVDPEGGWVIEQDVRELRTVSSQAFHSVPVDRLLDEGFVREVADTMVYHAPDAHALLSDAFLSTHCFWAVEDEDDDGRIGLAFEPLPDRRELPEIEGVLWLDRETAELRMLEYTYMSQPRDWRRYGFGGDVVFRRLEGGAWVVQRWEIRAPVVGVDPRSGDRRVVAVRETGGALLEATARAPDRAVRSPPPGSVAGRLVSDAGTPIEGALVYLSGTAYSDTTDADGEFRIEGVRAGEYALHWHHPELSGAVEGAGPQVIDVGAGRELVGRIEIAGAEALVAGGCGPTERRGGTGIVVGEVRHGRTDVVLTGVAVRLAAEGDDLDGVDAAGAALETHAGPGGLYRFCAVPPGEYVVRAALAEQGFAADTVRVAADRTSRVDLALALVGEADAPSDVAAGRPARIIGRVMDAVEGEPLPGAAVRIDSGRVHVTDENGRFAVDGLTPGPHRLEITHFGLEPTDATVTVAPGALLQLDLTLGPLELEGIEVVTQRTGPLADVYWRMERSRTGDFVTAEDIELRSPPSPAHILRGRPGWQLLIEGTSGRLGTLRSSRTGCAPTVYLDGVPVTPPAPAEGVRSDAAAMDAYEALTMVSPAEIELIELYRGAASPPAEFGGSAGQCGVVAIWLKRGR